MKKRAESGSGERKNESRDRERELRADGSTGLVAVIRQAHQPAFSKYTIRSGEREHRAGVIILFHFYYVSSHCLLGL